MHVHLCHEQGREQFCQLRRDFLQLDHYHLANPESYIVLAENVFYGFRIADYDPGDGRVGRLGDAERDDVSVAGAEQLHDIQHRADFVGQEDGELLYERAADLGRGLR